MKTLASNLFRKLGLLHLVDRVRFELTKRQLGAANRSFLATNPGVVLPPDYLMYESFQLNYQKYYEGGRETAEWLKLLLSKHIKLESKKILDWGCGPGRVIRHLPGVVNNGCHFHGTDYNESSIEWCRSHLPGIAFQKNSLQEKLAYPDGLFDVVYGISILTHLSEELHYFWMEELHRVLAPGGLLLITVHGDNFKAKLTTEELGHFDAGRLIVRGNVREGHRIFAAFQPRAFMLSLTGKFEVLRHLTVDPVAGRAIPQDVWILRKPSDNATGTSIKKA